MSVIETVSSTKGKCISCSFYDAPEDDWLVGNCTNADAKIKNKRRYYNQKCSRWSRKHDPH